MNLDSQVACRLRRPKADHVALFLRIYPSRQQYRLPTEEEAGDVTKSLAEVLGNRGCLVLGYELPDQPRNTAVVLINGNVVECAELIEVSDPQIPE
jgi:hypothetical protein